MIVLPLESGSPQTETLAALFDSTLIFVADPRKYQGIEPTFCEDLGIRRRVPEWVELPTYIGQDSKRFLQIVSAKHQVHQDILIGRTSFIMLDPATAYKVDLPCVDEVLDSTLSCIVQPTEPSRKVVDVAMGVAPTLVLSQCLDRGVEDSFDSREVSINCLFPASIHVRVRYEVNRLCRRICSRDSQ